MDDPHAALLIGTGTYNDPGLRDLRSPLGDIENLEKVLSDAAIGGYPVVDVLIDRGVNDVKRAIQGFFDSAGSRDTLLLYMSCHGVLSEDRVLHFATRETELDYLDSTSVDAEFVKRQMHRCRAESKIVILDCCHSGAFGRHALTKGPTGNADVGRLEEKGRGTIVLTASNDVEHALEEDRLVTVGEPAVTSLFTDVLIEGLRTGDADKNDDGDVTVDELYDWTYKRVVERTRAHRPDSFGELRGNIVIAKNPKRRVLPPPLLRMIKDDHARERRIAVGWLGSLLVGDDPREVDAAREALDALREDPRSDVADAARAALGAKRSRSRRTATPKPVDGRVETLQRRADGHLNERRHAAAVAVYAQALEASPDFVPALVGRGIALGRMRAFDDASADLDRAVELQPASAPARVARAQLLLARGRPSEALPDLEAALEAEPDSADALMARGIARSRADTQDLEAALADFALAASADPHHAEAVARHAIALTAIGRHAEAIRARDDAAARGPRSPEALTAMGAIDLELGEPGRAEASLNAALDMDRAQLEALVLRGRCRLGTKAVGALQDFDAALELAPDNRAAHFGRALVHRAAGAHVDALAALDAALAAAPSPGTWPDTATLCAERGEVLLALERLAEAVAAFDHSLTDRPEVARALVGRGRAQMALGRPELAFVDLGSAIAAGADEDEIAPQQMEALMSLPEQPSSGWPDAVLKAVDVVRESNRRLLDQANVGWRFADLISGTEQPLGICECARREDNLRHVRLLITSHRLLWHRETVFSKAQTGWFSWKDVRELRDRSADGFRAILSSGNRIEFVRLNEYTDLTGRGEHFDAAQTIELMRSLLPDR